jgi:hypothetical protein
MISSATQCEAEDRVRIVYTENSHHAVKDEMTCGTSQEQYRLKSFVSWLAPVACLTMTLLARAAEHVGSELVAGPTLLPCGGDGLASVADDLEGAVRGLCAETPVLVLKASTGSGKCKWLPSWLAKQFGPTLVYTTSRVDARDMAAKATVPCAWQVGGQREQGASRPLMRIQTAHLAAKKHLRDSAVLRGAGVIFFDEIDVAASDCQYAWLFEMCVSEAASRPDDKPLRIIVASATPGTETIKLVDQGCARLFQYEGRQHTVETASFHCCTVRDVYTRLASLGAALSLKGHSSMIFVPGEAEVVAAVAAVKAHGVFAEGAFGTMDAEEVEAALQAKSFPRVLVVTALGERAITLSDIEFAWDAGMSRRLPEACGIETCSDYVSGEATGHQRRGRVGRVRPGAYIRAVLPDTELKECTHGPSTEDVMAAFAAGMPMSGPRLCKPADETVGEAIVRVRALCPARETCRELHMKYPTSLFHAAAIEAAAGKDQHQRWDLRWEAAALVSLIETGACRKTLTDPELAFRAMREMLPHEVARDAFFVGRLKAARAMHNDICSRVGATPSTMRLQDKLEGVALAFLRTHLQLGIRRDGIALVAGYAVESAGPDGPVVLLGVRKMPYRAAKATVELPVTAWVKEHSSLRMPTQERIFAC